MISPSPKEYGFVQVGRELLGGEKFLATLGGLCAQYLGGKSVAATTDLHLVSQLNNLGDEELSLRQMAIPFVTPEYEIPPANELELVLVHRGVRRELTSRYKTRWTATQLSSRKTGRKHRRTESLHDVFERIAVANGQELEGEGVYFDTIVQLPNSGRDKILGLLPRQGHETTTTLAEQAAAAEWRLRDINPRLAAEKAPWDDVAAPCVRIPGSTPDSVYDRLVCKINTHLPLRLPLGSILVGSDRFS